MLAGDNNICNISDYQEDKEYDVYMYAEDIKGTGINLKDVLETKKTLITTNQPATNPPSTSGFENMKYSYSNFFHNNSRLYKERKQHIEHINKILINLNEMDNSGYFLIQSDTCANKTTNAEYELCMKRVLQEVLFRIKTPENKDKFLQSLKQTKINITGLNKKLI